METQPSARNSSSCCRRAAPFRLCRAVFTGLEASDLSGAGLCALSVLWDRSPTPPYHGTSQASGGNRSQRIWLRLAVFAARRFAADCQPLQPRGSIKMTCSETSSAQACYPRGVVHVGGARGGPDDDRSRIGCASKADHVHDARPRVG